MIGNLKEKLFKTSETFKDKFEEFFRSDKSREEILEELSESMILADIGVNTTEKIISSIKEKSRKNDTFLNIRIILEEEVKKMLSQFSSDFNLDYPRSVVMFVGINGGGKTTSLAKVAYHYQKKKKTKTKHFRCHSALTAHGQFRHPLASTLTSFTI